MHSWIKTACMIVLLAMVAIPLSNLLVSQDAPATRISEVDETGTFEKDLLTTGAADASAASQSRLSGRTASYSMHKRPRRHSRRCQVRRQHMLTRPASTGT